jgi:hypothetical protein
MEISGHKTRSIFDRYDIVSEADIASVAERTEEYLKARKEPANKLRRAMISPNHSSEVVATDTRNPMMIRWLCRSCGCGEIGRRAGFRFQFPRGSVGSSPIIRTIIQ